jgi:ABC-type branched-subunit amino acid transport system permease subunit
MKPSNRILFLGILLEAGLFALGAYLLGRLADGSLKAASSIAETTTTITTMLGGAMGGLAGLFLVIYLVLRTRGS